MRLQCFPPTHYVRGGAARAHKRDDLYPLLSKLEYRLPACIVWLYLASSSFMWWFLDNFFCLVCGLAFAMFAHKKITGARGTLTTLYRTSFTVLLLGSIMSFLAFCGSPMHSTSTMWCFPDNCFFSA